MCLTKLLEGIVLLAVLLKDQLLLLGPVMSKVTCACAQYHIACDPGRTIQIMPLVTFHLEHVKLSLVRREKISNLRRKAASVLVRIASTFADKLVVLTARRRTRTQEDDACRVPCSLFTPLCPRRSSNCWRPLSLASVKSRP